MAYSPNPFNSTSRSSQDSNYPDLEAESKSNLQSRRHFGVRELLHGPIDPTRHSKWPYFFRLRGSILPKMAVSLFLVGLWATGVTLMSNFVWDLGIKPNLLTVTGFVVGLAISFRSSTAYERFSEGRRYWAQLQLTTRNLARLIWVHSRERHDESAELGKRDLLAKLAALNLLNAFAVSLKHRLRFEPFSDYPDLHPLISNLRLSIPTGSEEAINRNPNHNPSLWRRIGMALDLPFASDNPRQLLKTMDRVGNGPLEILTHLSAYIEKSFQNKQLPLPGQQTQAMLYLTSLTEVLTGTERVVNTPLPAAYTIAVSQITWAYVIALPFQLEHALHWIAIPATLVAAYIILSLSQIGKELENPFGNDCNDLPLDMYCREIAQDIHMLTSKPPPLDLDAWMHADGGSQVLWPLSGQSITAFQGTSVEEIRGALRYRAEQTNYT